MWKLKCLICGATPETLDDQLSVRFYGQLVAMQEHMVDHGISLETQRQCTRDEKDEVIVFKVKGFDNRELRYLEARREMER